MCVSFWFTNILTRRVVHSYLMFFVFFVCAFLLACYSLGGGDNDPTLVCGFDRE